MTARRRDGIEAGRRDGDRRLWRALVGLYPPSWRRRYADELLALLADQATPPRSRPAVRAQPAAGLARTAVSLLVNAAAAWLRPVGHLHTRASRITSSTATLLVVWVGLAAAALVFGQLNEQQATQTVTPGHPITRQLYAAYALAAHLSSAVLVLACAPLYGTLARAVLGGRDRRGVVFLAAPLVVPPVFLLVLAAVSRAVRHPDAGVGQTWFFLLTLAGLVAAALAVTGPVAVLRRYGPVGRSAHWALLGCLAAVAVMGTAMAATVVNLALVRAWGDTSIVHAPVPVIAGYATLITATLGLATASGARGLRAMLVH